MAGLICLCDATSHGGKVISASTSMFIESIQVALVDDCVPCLQHDSNRIIKGTVEEMENSIALPVDNCLCEWGCRVISDCPEIRIEIV